MFAIASLDKGTSYSPGSLEKAVTPYASTIRTLLIPAEVHTLFHKIAPQKYMVHNARQIHLQ